MSWRRGASFYGKKQKFHYHRNGRNFTINPNNLADEGWKMEERVEQILHGMFNRGAIQGFEHHQRNSPEDQLGKDFTVQKTVNDQLVTKSFGISISGRRTSQTQALHPSVPQFHFSLWFQDEAIQEVILGLFL